MEGNSTTKTSKLKNRKGQKDKKCEFVIPLQFRHDPSMKILPKTLEEPVVLNESEDSDFPALPGYTEDNPSTRLNIHSSTSFSTVLTRKPQVQNSNIRIQLFDNSCSPMAKPDLPFNHGSLTQTSSSASKPAKTSGGTKTTINNSKSSDSKSRVPDTNLTLTSAPIPSTKKDSTASQLTKSEKRNRRRSKKASKVPQGKVNTLTQEQYNLFTEQNDSKSITSLPPNLTDQGEYPALGLSPFRESNVRVKTEPSCDETESHAQASENGKNENQDSVSPITQLPSQKGGPLTKTTKTSPKLEKPSSDKKFNSPIQMNLVDMLSKVKLTSSKANLKVQSPLSAKRDKIKGPGKHGILNSLDSSGPTRKRGKEREIPKKPKLSKIKKVILKERVEKRLRLALLSMRKVREQGIISENTSHKKNDIASLESELQELDLSDKSNETSLPAVVKLEVEPEDNVQETIVQSEEEREQMLRLKCAKKLLHCRKFREYCNHFISEEIDTLTNNLMAELVRYQDRLFMRDPVKARARKRFVCGLKEVTKNLKLRKLKLIIVAPDIEEINSEGGLNDALHCILHFCENYVTPLMFSLPRRKLGKVCKKKVPLSCVGIFNYEGTEDIYKELMDLVEEARQVYKQTLALAQQNLTDEMIQILCDDKVDHGKVEEMRTLFWQSPSNH